MPKIPGHSELYAGGHTRITPGSETLPGLCFTNDYQTGIFQGSQGHMGLTSNGIAWLEVNSDKDLVAHGKLLFEGDNATYWLDLDFPISLRITGANRPTIDTLVGNIKIPRWAVDDYADIEGQELPHSWKRNSDLSWHIHYHTNGSDVDDRYVRFEIEVAIATNFGTISAVDTIDSGDILVPGGTADRTMRVFGIGTTSPGDVFAPHIFARLKRVAATGTAPSSDPFVNMLQAHYENNALGSRNSFNDTLN